MAHKHIIIVGAGPGGLTAAMILAHRGFRVTVFEAKGAVGGRNAALMLGDYRFETGPTFLMMDFILKEMFAEAGRKIEDYLTFRRLDILYNLLFHDMTLLSFFDRNKMKEEIRARFPGNENGLDRFLSVEAKRYAMLFPCIQKHYSSLVSMISWPLIRALPYLGLTTSMFGILGRYFKPEQLRLSFTFQSKYLGMSPWECPALFTMIPFIEHSNGICHVMGGLSRIPEAMARAVIEDGGAIHLSSPVASLVIDRGAVKGVRLADGRTVLADDVIINADFAYAMNELVAPGVLRKYSPRNIAKKRFSCSTFMLYLGIDKQYDMPHHTIVFARDYAVNINNIFHAGVLSDDISLYIQNASATDPSLAPPGKSTVYVLVPVPNLTGSVDWAAERDRFRDKVLTVIEQRTAMKDLRRHIETEKVLTPADWEREHNIYRGATFNLAHTLSQLLYLRPRNRFEELENCYLVGGGTHPGSGLPTIYESARISSNLLCKKYGVPYHRPTPWPYKSTVQST